MQNDRNVELNILRGGVRTVQLRLDCAPYQQKTLQMKNERYRLKYTFI